MTNLIYFHSLKHTEIGQRVGKSREYVSNTLRILLLPEDMRTALASGEISEGHTRPLLMLVDRPEEQKTLFTEITAKRLTVRDSEQVARRVATDRVRKQDLTPDLLMLERELTEKLGTRVRIEKKDQGGGGKVLIDFFSPEDLAQLRIIIAAQQEGRMRMSGVPEAAQQPITGETEIAENAGSVEENASIPLVSEDQTDADLYSVTGFTV